MQTLNTDDTDRRRFFGDQGLIQERHFNAVITDIRLESREGDRARWQMALDRTDFRAGDTGVLEAVSRTGTKIEVPVIAVIEENGDVWHVVEKPLAAGTDVVGRVKK